MKRLLALCVILAACSDLPTETSDIAPRYKAVQVYHQGGPASFSTSCSGYTCTFTADSSGGTFTVHDGIAFTATYAGPVAVHTFPAGSDNWVRHTLPLIPGEAKTRVDCRKGGRCRYW